MATNVEDALSNFVSAVSTVAHSDFQAALAAFSNKLHTGAAKAASEIGGVVSVGAALSAANEVAKAKADALATTEKMLDGVASALAAVKAAISS